LNLAPALLTVALSLPPPASPRGYDPEPRADYETRVSTIAISIGAVSKTPEEAAGLLVLAYGESRFDALVHAGLTHPVLDQDHGRARSLWQLHASGIVPEWSTLGGTDVEATTRAARAALRVLRSAAWMCTHSSMLTADDMARAFAEYGRGDRSCMPTRQSIARAQQWERVRARLWRPE